MTRRIFPLLLLGCLTLLSAPVLVGVSPTGECLSLGSGWHGDNARHAPAVADDGLVTFIAPDYQEATTLEQAKAFCAVYQAQITDNVPKASELYSGFDTLLYDFLCIIPPYPSRDAAGIRHFELAECGDTFARLTREYKGGSNDNIFRSTYLRIGSLKADLQQDGNISGLSVAGNGKFAIVHNTQNNSYLLFSLANNAIVTQNSTIPQGNGRACLNSDGTAIWLASTAGLAGKSAGPLRLYRYRLATKTTTYLADLQDTSETKFGLTDAQLAAAANAETVALVSNNAALWGGTPTVATVGRQVLLATLDSSGNVHFTRCGKHYKGGAPSVSADGRFVAFTATPTSSDATTQIYRYDTLTENLEKVSGDANKDCDSPAISPSGRFVALVSDADNLGASNGYPNVYGIDLGCTLTADESCTVYVGMAEHLPIIASGALPSDTISLNWPGKLPGTLKNSKGAIVVKGKAFAASLLPLRFMANQKGSTELTATLSDGQTASLALYSAELGTPTTQLASAKEDGTLYIQGYYGGFREGGTFAFSADGSTILFSTIAPLSNDDTDIAPDAYAYDLATSQLTRLTNGVSNAQHFAYSADGTTCAALVKSAIQVFANGELTATIANAASAPALNGDGTAIAFIGTDGLPKLYSKGSLTSLAAPDATPCANPWISADGTSVACLQDGTLLLWTAPGVSPVTVAANVTSFSATADATQFLVCNASGCQLRSATGATLKSITDITDTNKPVLAANGRFIALYKQPDSSTPYQLYRRDLTVDMDTLLSATPGGDYLDSTANRFPPAISADGISVAFATAATNLVEGKVSKVSLELYAATITLQATTLWRNAPTPSTEWTLLSTPVAIYAETLEQIFGAKPWYWQGNGWTQDAGEIIQAGTGFIVWHASYPPNITVSSLGQNPIPPTPGWNLVGPVLGAETNFVQDGDFSWDEQSATWLSAPPGEATTGKAYWHFSR